MIKNPVFLNKLLSVFLLFGLIAAFPAQLARANTNAQGIPFYQDWTNPGLITTEADWSDVPGVMGYKGDSGEDIVGADPQTILNDNNTVMVIPNMDSVDTPQSGVAEFEITNPTIALKGSLQADAPYLLINLDTTGKADVTVSYDVRDIDWTIADVITQVALHYRVGSSGLWTNLPGGYIPDATTGDYLADLVTHVSVTLPAETDNQPLVQVRIMTTNSAPEVIGEDLGLDEWIGIDNILISEAVADVAPTVTVTSPLDNATDVAWDANLSITFSEAVNVSGTWFIIICTESGAHTAVVSGGPLNFTLDPAVDFTPGETCTVTIYAAQVTDVDTNEPPDNMAVDYSWSFTTEPEYPIWLPLIMR